MRTCSGRFVGTPPQIQSHLYRSWPTVHITNSKDCNNDAFAPHSALLALTATITVDRQRQLSSLSVWVESDP